MTNQVEVKNKIETFCGNSCVIEHENPRIKLKSIAEFLDGKHHFIIPSYQRGYRWEERQILDLLDDVLEFQKEIKNKKCDKIGEFYCLQPIVVLKKDDKWEVIDGQQRLTTIFILLSSLKEALKILKLPTTLFSIEYETREKEGCSSKEFLQKITSVESINKTNIDFYRMSDAFLIIKKWLENDNINLGDFCNTLLTIDVKNGIDEANNVRFIWYELNSDGDKPNIAFSKYNQGKIDLTNAELIKAIFYLSDSSFNDNSNKKYQYKIGYEWDDIENTLQKEDFWKFINPNSEKEYPNRIEFIFEMIADKYFNEVNLKINKSIDRYWSFYVFNELITRNIKRDDRYENTRDFLWDEVKTYYRTFFEWYDDNTYYHIIGFLLFVNKKTEDIKKLAETKSKEDFISDLKEMVKEHFEQIDFEQIGYYDNDKKARQLLLLFNIVTTMNSHYNRFPFDKFASENWSLEHIHAQQSENLTPKEQKMLLEEQINDVFLCERQDIISKINELLLANNNMDKTHFDDLQKEIFTYSSDAETTIHSIKNLALLTPSDNSCLNNKSFHKKRDKIKELDEKGSFIPICTKNVFLKYYSKNVKQNVKWDRKDMDEYLKEIKNVLTSFIKEKEKENERDERV